MVTHYRDNPQHTSGPHFRCFWAITVPCAPTTTCTSRGYWESTIIVSRRKACGGNEWSWSYAWRWPHCCSFSVHRSLCSCLLPSSKQNHWDHPLNPESHVGPNDYIWWNWNLWRTPNSSTEPTQSYHWTFRQWPSGRQFGISKVIWGMMEIGKHDYSEIWALIVSLGQRWIFRTKHLLSFGETKLRNGHYT